MGTLISLECNGGVNFFKKVNYNCSRIALGFLIPSGLLWFYNLTFYLLYFFRVNWRCLIKMFWTLPCPKWRMSVGYFSQTRQRLVKKTVTPDWECSYEFWQQKKGAVEWGSLEDYLRKGGAVLPRQGGRQRQSAGSRCTLTRNYCGSTKV